MKSHLSSPSTVDSPLFSPRKGFTLDSDLEDDQACHCFMENGFCNRGTSCEAAHEAVETVTNSNFMLNNYPELIIGCMSRRSLFSHLWFLLSLFTFNPISLSLNFIFYFSQLEQ